MKIILTYINSVFKPTHSFILLNIISMNNHMMVNWILITNPVLPLSIRVGSGSLCDIFWVSLSFSSTGEETQLSCLFERMRKIVEELPHACPTTGNKYQWLYLVNTRTSRHIFLIIKSEYSYFLKKTYLLEN